MQQGSAGRPAGSGGPEKWEGNDQGTAGVPKGVWGADRGRGGRCPECRAGSELGTTPHSRRSHIFALTP